MKAIRLLMAAALVVPAAGVLDAQEVTLRPKPRVRIRTSGAVRIVKLPRLAAPAARPKAEPKYASRRPAYFALPLGPARTPCTLALDESGGTGKGYDRLYADVNGNGDLSDDPPVAGMNVVRVTHRTSLFMGAKVLVDYAGQKALWHFDAFSQTALSGEDQGTTVLSVRPVGCYEGEVPANGKKLKVLLVDADSTGCFNDPPGVEEAAPGKEATATGDRVLIDVDGDGKFDSSGSEAFPCAKRLQVGDACYRLAIAPSGQSLTWAQAKVPMGSLAREGGGIFNLRLLSPENGMVTVSSDGEKPAKVAAGKHRIDQCLVEIKDGDETVWKAQARGTPGGKQIEVAEGKTTTARFGPPLKLGVTARVLPEGSLDAVRPGDALSLGLKITGQCGEAYGPVALLRGRQRPQAPEIKLLGPDGEVVVQGTMKYG